LNVQKHTTFLGAKFEIFTAMKLKSKGHADPLFTLASAALPSYLLQNGLTTRTSMLSVV